MHNTWLIIRREYLERVRSRAFIIFTLLMPALIGAIVILPAKMAGMKGGGARNIVIVASNASVASAVRDQLSKLGSDQPQQEEKELGEKEDALPRFQTSIETQPSAALRSRLVGEISSGKLDGYLWLSDEAIAARKFTYSTKNSSDFIETSAMRNAVETAMMREKLQSKGISVADSEEMLKPVSMDTIRVDKGTEKKSTSMVAFFLPFLLMMMIYMTVLLYGVAVMRSVLEEKTTRVVEVLLSSVTAKQLMAGKILGVGAVGLTQILIWATLGGVVSAPAMIAMRPYLAQLQMPIGVYISFPVFFVMGYLLYSTMYATVASMVNSEEEAQQMQWPIMLPLILCTAFAMTVIRQPNSQLALWTSMFPLTAPIIMFVRIVSQQPPLWQILLCLGILALTIYGLVSLCSRIYRVGILMYGKRPTLPEIMKWVKYSG